MARLTSFQGILCVWLTILTLIPLYLLFSGRYTLTRRQNQSSSVELTRRGGPPDELSRFKRGVHVAGDSKDTKQESSSFGVITKADSADSKIIQREIKKAFITGNTSNPRAAFEHVVLLSSLLPKITNISRINTPSPEAFRNYIAPMGMPVIFTDMLKGEKLSQWTWEYIRSKWGHVVYHNTRQGEYSTKVSKLGKHYVNRVSVQLADFIDIVTGKKRAGKSEEGMYITKQRVIPVEALEQEFTYPKFYPGTHKKCYLEPTGWWVQT